MGGVNNMEILMSTIICYIIFVVIVTGLSGWFNTFKRERLQRAGRVITLMAVIPYIVFLFLYAGQDISLLYDALCRCNLVTLFKGLMGAWAVIFGAGEEAVSYFSSYLFSMDCIIIFYSGIVCAGVFSLEKIKDTRQYADYTRTVDTYEDDTLVSSSSSNGTAVVGGSSAFMQRLILMFTFSLTFLLMPELSMFGIMLSSFPERKKSSIAKKFWIVILVLTLMLALAGVICDIIALVIRIRN